MRKWILAMLPVFSTVIFSSVLQAQQPAPPSRDAIPDKIPFGSPYGAPVSAQRAEALIQAAVSEASKKGWPMNIAVVDSGANLVALLRMDGAMLGSISIAQHKARAAATFRRPTKVFEDSVQNFDFKYLLSIDDMIAGRGGVPLIEEGRVIGAIGCSGGTGSQDEAICMTAAAVINK